jgi:hypothetical protein
MASEGVWSACEVIPVAHPDSREPVLAIIGETVHLVWNYNKGIYHSWRSVGGWTPPTKVAIGEQPALRATPDGRLHCLFVNQFARNYEIYYVWWDGAQWTLPMNVSRTYGVSTQPSLAVGPDNTLHAVWADSTPGYSVIYYGTRVSAFWANRPLPTGRGTAPAVAVSPDSEIIVAWQERREDTGVYDVLCSTNLNGSWGAPESISDSAQGNSLFPSICVSPGAEIHLLWQEEINGQYRAYHAQRHASGWSQPEDVSEEASDCRLARLASNPLGYVHAAWSDGGRIVHCIKAASPDASWRNVETPAADCWEPMGLDIAVSAARRAHIVWSALDDSAVRMLFWARREPFPKYSLNFPVAVG